MAHETKFLLQQQKKNSSHLFSKQLKEGVSWTFDTPSSFLSSTATRQ